MVKYILRTAFLLNLTTSNSYDCTFGGFQFRNSVLMSVMQKLSLLNESEDCIFIRRTMRVAHRFCL